MNSSNYQTAINFYKLTLELESSAKRLKPSFLLFPRSKTVCLFAGLYVLGLKTPVLVVVCPGVLRTSDLHHSMFPAINWIESCSAGASSARTQVIAVACTSCTLVISRLDE